MAAPRDWSRTRDIGQEGCARSRGDHSAIAASGLARGYTHTHTHAGGLRALGIMQVPCDRVLAFAAGLASGCVVVEGAREAAMLTGPSTATDRMAISAPRTTPVLNTWFAIAHWAHAMLSTCAPVCWCGRGKAQRTIFRFSAGSATLRCAGCNPCGTIDRGPPHRYGTTTRGPRPGRSTFVETSCSPLVSLCLWDVSVRCGGCETWCETQRRKGNDGGRTHFRNCAKIYSRRACSISRRPPAVRLSL